MRKRKNKKIKVIRLTYNFIIPSDLKKTHVEKLDKLIVKTLEKAKIKTQKFFGK